jgi:ATP-dependent helicase HrpA
LVAEGKGAQEARMREFRWLLEELRTPQSVSIKWQDKAWGQLNH